MNNLDLFRPYAFECIRGNHLRLIQEFLDTKIGFHGGLHLLARE
jgi:hypothetical protein